MSAVVYRFMDAAGRLLYVGCSGNLGQRLASHGGKPWFPEVATIAVEHYATRTAALWAEAHAIATESPVHNTQHATRPATTAAPMGRPKGMKARPLLAYEMLGGARKGIAAAARVSPSHLSEIVNARKGATHETASRIAAVLNREVAELFEVAA